MKYLINCFIALLMIAGCKNITPETYETSGVIEGPRKEEAGSMKQEEEKKAAAFAAVPEETKQKISKAREEKRDKSIFNDLGCCTTHRDSLCCCEPVYEKYLELLAHGDKSQVDKIRREDPYLNNCIQKFPQIKNKIDALEMAEEE